MPEPLSMSTVKEAQHILDTDDTATVRSVARRLGVPHNTLVRHVDGPSRAEAIRRAKRRKHREEMWEKAKTAAELVFGQDLTYREAAERLGVAHATIKRRIDHYRNPY